MTRVEVWTPRPALLARWTPSVAVACRADRIGARRVAARVDEPTERVRRARAAAAAWRTVADKWNWGVSNTKKPPPFCEKILALSLTPAALAAPPDEELEELRSGERAFHDAAALPC